MRGTMRVIAGSAGSLRLKTIEGTDTRPTTDRIKETLFNMIQNEIPGARALDLFAGSGAIGIEALSRGAKAAVFVENNKSAAKCIEENLRHTKLYERSRLLCMDCAAAVIRLKKEEPFDLVFMDPPYNKALEEDMLRLFLTSPAVTEETLIITEAALETDFSYLPEIGFTMLREKRYKTNKHVFIKRTA